MFNRNDTKKRLEDRVRELEGERERLRDAIAGFREALAATHDSEQLQRVIVDTAIEAVGAKGGMLVPPSGAIVQVGDLSGVERLQLPLTASRQNFGSLILVGDEFLTEDRLTATSFAAHAVVALENARLHRVVERQALIDGLTGLANRRQSEDALATEISRAGRWGGEEFLLLLPGTDNDGGMLLAERIRATQFLARRLLCHEVGAESAAAR